MTARTRLLLGAACAALFTTACSDAATSPKGAQPSGARASMVDASLAGTGSDERAVTAVNLAGHWNGQATWSFLGTQPVVSQLFLTEDATGNLTGVLSSLEKCDLGNTGVIIDCIEVQTFVFAGTAKTDGTFSAKTVEGFSITGKTGTQICSDGSSAVAIIGTCQQSGAFGYQGSYSVNACLPAPHFILQHPELLP